MALSALESLLTRVRPKPRLTTTADLGNFLDRQASFLTQKSITEFCRVRSGVYWAKLFSEAEFQQALTRSTWMGYTPALAMAAELAEGMLRRASDGRAAEVRAAVVQLATDVRGAHTPPPQVDLEAWAAQQPLVAERLALASLAPPRPVRFLPDPLARLIFEGLPLHVDIVANDFDYIFNNLRMNLLRAHDDFATAADVPAIVKSLLDA